MGKIARNMGEPSKQQYADFDKKYGKGNYMIGNKPLQIASHMIAFRSGNGTPSSLKESTEQRANREWGEGNYITEDFEAETPGGRKVKNKLYVRKNNLSKGNVESSSSIEIRRDKRSSFMTSGTTKGTLG